MTLGARVRLARKAGRLAAMAAGTAVVIAGCGEPAEPERGAQGGAHETTVSSPSTSVIKEDAAVTSVPPTTVAGTPARKTPEPARGHGNPLCTSAQLSLDIGAGEGAAGTVWRALRFTNSGDTACRIQGFPGVSYVAGDDGHQVGAAAYRAGTKGDSVTLQPGDVAHAPVGFVQVGNYDADECKPTEVRGLRVYPPQETKSLYLPHPGTGCANESMSSSHLTVHTIQEGPGPR